MIHKRFAASLVLALTTSVGTGAGAVYAGSAPATPSTTMSVPSTCSGARAAKIAKRYYPPIPYRTVPLRCGTSSYGYNHIKARWNADFDSTIALTIPNPSRVENDGTTSVFVRNLNQCPAAQFRVVVQYNNYNDGEPKGIISAYETSAFAAKADKANPALC